MYRTPQSGEYAEYFATYVRLVQEEDVISQLNADRDELLIMLSRLTPEQETYRYAPDKWSVRELIGHMIDTERIMAYRLLAAARGDRTSLPGFNENEYAAASNFNSTPLSSISREFAAVRQATVLLLEGLSEEAWSRRGVVRDNEISVRALAAVIAGHARHHVSVLRERYGLSNP